MKRLLFSLSLLLTTTTLSAQVTDYDFTFNISGDIEDTIILGQYYGNRMIYKDTAAVEKGVLNFKRKDNELKNGMYGLVIPDSNGNQYFNFIVNNESKIVIDFNTNDLVYSTKVSKSEENKLYYDYLNFLKGLNDEAKPLRDQYEKAEDPKDKEAAKEKLSKFGDRVKVKQEEIKAGKSFFSNVLGMKSDIEVPANDDNTWRYQYYKKHYFDNFDFTNDAIVNTFDFHEKLVNFFEKVVAQAPDSIIKELDILLTKTPEYSESYKYIINYAIRKYETSKVICMDNIFVHIALKYFATGKVSWFDEENTKKVVDRAKEMEPTRCGIPAPRIMLPDTNNKWHDLYAVKAKYKVLIFWEHTCGHCKKELPKIVEVMKNFDPSFAKVFAVEIDEEMEGMKEYMRENDISDFINVGDYSEIRENAPKYIQQGLTTYESLNYRKVYDIFSTPKVFILDENNIIKAKQLGSEQIEELLNHFKEEQEKDKN